MTTSTDAGHRLVTHRTEYEVEAWATERAGCFLEALHGLLDEFVVPAEEPAVRSLPLSAPAGGPEEMLASLLEEVVLSLVVFSVVPVRFHLADTEEGGVAGDMEVIPLSCATLKGTAPKAISRRDLSMSVDGGLWCCRYVAEV